LNANPAIGSHERFGLITDSFDFKFVDNINYPNNLASYANQKVFTYSNSDVWIYCDTSAGSPNYAKPVVFSILRGYKNGNGSGYDYIYLTRTASSYTFTIDISGGGPNVDETTAQQTFSNVYQGQVLTVNAAVGVGPNVHTYDLGLKLNVLESIVAQSDSLSYEVYASVANFLSNVDSNPYNPGTIGILKYGFITDNQQQELFESNTDGVYIANIKAACIKSYGKYYLSIVRNVPDLHVYLLDTPSFIGNPVSRSSGEWYLAGDVSYNDFLLVGYVASNLTVYRQGTHVMFYNSYSSYYVVAPPSFDVYGYKSSLNISSVPLRSTSVLFCSFDVNPVTNSYVVTANTTAVTSPLTLSQPTPSCYTSYLNTSQTKYSFELKGYYVKVTLYNGGIGADGTASSPFNTDISSNFY